MIGIHSKADAKYHAKKTAHHMKPWARKAARAGFMAKGTNFILVGALSLLAACGAGSKAKGTNGAMAAVAAKPYGEVLLWLIGIGLAGYILWLLIQIFELQTIKEDPMKGSLRKAGNVISCIIYIGLAAKAIKLAIHAGQSSSAQKAWTARILAQDYGPLLIGLIGAGIIIYGIYSIFSGIKGSFMKQFKLQEMSKEEIQATRKSGQIGMVSRGAVFGFLGYFVIRMAITANPHNPTNLDGALQKILQQSYGPWMLGIVSIGFALYGIFQISKGKNKHINL
ncbi:DUF1206 domain-containing protein [Bacillus sp. MUM 13]|uniref:DUF1206 domain-containing protein n=1 Tax=Bacillus sp. MUM 13 TaxID=1678001 RepID=UPI00147B1C19|nr:DUF1206 domain-containing protein [Bacillus sp. MUM 13]